MQHHADPIPLTPRAEVSSAELVKEALSEARHLIRLEVALAKEEVRRELSATKKAAITLGIGALAIVLALAVLLVALALAIFPGPVPALVIGLVLLIGGAFAVFTGIRLIPKKPLGETIRRIETDIETVKGRVA
jgi:fatty acid desaturase